ncbi:TonB-dependent receptor [Chitinophaga japonensis]|uniref:Outer membrane receptor protein involved in Fe transport n=1 Tax=Chitinophaga japonensis TaxID=104662 RepID=A0A562SSI8_CHIJA|nr:TonB-dependent receptor [Chitinophaga japonensis]TWI84211.1 outer membrane receptor protein involved in Fe transport [Chitinophaga japonensis]
MKATATVLLLLLAATAKCQTITGYITGADKKPLEGATIYHLRTGHHTHSNEFGAFQLAGAGKGDSLKVTHVAYTTKVVVAETAPFRIVLTPSPLELNEVAVISTVKHLNIISDIDLQTNPVNSSQELLRTVPGLFIGQHAGGGKAEQMFLRGFDLDHGTDINITVDGMPVNMVSHAHGQGYADLHFLVPETVEQIDFDKGPYHAGKGNMATAGYVAFETKERLDNSAVTLQAGRFNTVKTLGLFNLVNNEKQSAYLATEYLVTDGPFISPQNFNRLNLMGKYTAYLADHDKVSIAVSHFSSKWDASGQIPQRAVDAGLITRFGAIDDTEGGNTQRTNINLQFTKQLDASSYVKNTAYFSRYDFELYSNFTFFLNDPENGDQIRQKEKRNIMGFESQLNKVLNTGRSGIHLQAALGLRNDAVKDVELSHTANRKTTLETVQLGDVNEANLYGYVNADIRIGKWLINPGLRADYMKFDYVDKLAGTYRTQAESKAILSPKLNFLYTQNNNLQYFIKLGKGFHSNDTRVVVAEKGREILPAAYGADAGLTWKPLPRLIVNTALWYLYLQQEFVYVGDEGVVEPGGRTQRQGADLGIRYQLLHWLFFNTDLTYTYARSMDEPKDADYIPLAPDFTFSGGFSWQHRSGITGSIKSRYMGSRPANEDNSIVAKGYFITDMNLGYQWKQFTLGVIMENIFNTEWNETQFATESRLQTETAPVTEIHFTPGVPFNIRGSLTFRF